MVESVLFSMATATGRWPCHSRARPVSGSVGAGVSGSLSLGRKAQPASSAAAKMRQSAVRMRFIVMSLMGLLAAEIAQLVVVHQCKVGLAPVEGHLFAGLGVKLEGVGGIGLFPAAHLHAAAGEEVGVAALDVLHLLHVMGVACVGVHVGEADHDVLEGKLLTGQLIDGVLGGLLGGVVHLHRVGVAECGVAERGAVALRMYDGDFFGRGFTLEFVDLVGAVVGKVEERPLAGSVEADAGIRSGLADLLAGGELGVLVGHIAAAVIAVGDDGVDGGLEIILAADVQPGVAVDADELGAEDALAVVVVEDVPGHEQLQELVAA